MILEMAAMFEQYHGKKSSMPTNPSTTPPVDLSMVEVKPSNNGSTPVKISVPFLRKMVVLGGCFYSYTR
jgi:hypothetical protein